MLEDAQNLDTGTGPVPVQQPVGRERLPVQIWAEPAAETPKGRTLGDWSTMPDGTAMEVVYIRADIYEKVREALEMVHGFYMAPGGTFKTNHPAYPRHDDNYSAKRLIAYVREVLGYPQSGVKRNGGKTSVSLG